MSTERIWEPFLTERDRAYATAYPTPPKGTGVRPCLLLLDLYRGAFGDRPEPLLEAVRTWPASCGEAGWDALPSIRRLLDAARSAGIPVVHATGLADVPAWADATPRSRPLPTADDALDRQRRKYDIIDEVAPAAGEVVLRKAAPSAFWGTPLAGLLTGLHVDTIVVAGETTSGCVRATVVDAKSYRYKVLVPEPCVFDRTESSHALSLFDLDQKYADVVTLEAALRYIEQAAAGSGPSAE
jgi:nicotinamidase-related amidase